MKLQELYDKLADAPASMPISIIFRIGKDRSWWSPITETEFKDGKFIIASVVNLENTTTTVECMMNSIQDHLGDNPEILASWRIAKDDTPIISTIGNVPIAHCQVSFDKLKFQIKASD